MKTKTTSKPTWTTLYSIGAMGVVALFSVPSLRLSPLTRMIDMLLIIVALYGVMAMWLSANSDAIEREDFGPHKVKYRIRWNILGAGAAQNPTPPLDTTNPTQTHQEVA